MLSAILPPDEEQKSLCAEMARFGATLNEGLADRDAGATFDRAHWRSCGEKGIPGLPIPVEYGGGGRNLVTTMLAMMALGRACRDNGLVFGLGAQMWSVQLPILQFGTEEQKQRFLPALCRGEIIGAHAITEPESGSDAMGLAASALKDGDHYVLNGTKVLITNAPVADLILCFATMNPALRSMGITGFLLERGMPDLELSAPTSKMGLRTAQMGQVVLRDCRVPFSSRLGPEGAGMMIFNAGMEAERIGIFAAHLGAMERLLEETVAHARRRKQFGVPIAKHAVIADKIVDMKVAIEAGRLLLHSAAATKDAGGNAMLHAAIAKLFVSEAHVRQALDAIQIHGGCGFLTEYGVERELRDAIPGTLYSGTSEMQRKIIARLMGLT
jgi:alkylation response protein AidB-like acyl-CoA dehydrogenase